MPISEPYLVPIADVVFEEEIKKSRFITYLSHTPTLEAAKLFVQQIKARHSTAHHNCWAFVAGRPNDSMKWGFSDDGEPSGTAGKPMLAQLTGANIGELTAVVTRYYGGVRLGTGGLVKAYGGGVHQALALLETEQKLITSQVKLTCEYNQISLIDTILAEYSGIVLNADYSHQINMLIEIDSRVVAEFCGKLTNRSSGRIIATLVSTP